MSSTFHPDSRSKVGAKPASLDEALSNHGYRGALNIKALASEMGLRAGYLHEAMNPNRDDTHFQARHIIPLVRASQRDDILEFLCESAGGVFVRLDRTQAAPDAETANVLREFSDYLREVADSQADARLTTEEFARVKQQADEAIAAVLGHLNALQAKVEPVRAEAGR